MQCPHCLEHFHQEPPDRYDLGRDVDANWGLGTITCAACCKFIISLNHLDRIGMVLDGSESMVYPKGSSRPPVPGDVPEEFRKDYQEACLVLADSPQASAALSRRCLQHLLREKAGVKGRNLHEEIQAVIESDTLPSDLTKSIDLIRDLGNTAVHPTKNTNTGEIVPVEPDEAEWCLTVIELLYDFYFVRPADVQRRQQAFHGKRHGATKSPDN